MSQWRPQKTGCTNEYLNWTYIFENLRVRLFWAMLKCYYAPFNEQEERRLSQVPFGLIERSMITRKSPNLLSSNLYSYQKTNGRLKVKCADGILPNKWSWLGHRKVEFCDVVLINKQCKVVLAWVSPDRTINYISDRLLCPLRTLLVAARSP